MGVRRALSVLAVAVVVLVGGAPVPAFAHHSTGGSNGYPMHWLRRFGSRPQVTFVDHTPARWKVRASVEKWNLAPNIDSLYSWQTCPAGAMYCVHVYEVYDTSGFYGRYLPKPPSFDGSGHVSSPITVQFNRFHAPNANRDRSTVCHELGHALGLAHTGAGDSCMFGTGNVFPLYPNQHDYDQLSCVYSHERADGGTVVDPRACLP